MIPSTVESRQTPRRAQTRRESFGDEINQIMGAAFQRMLSAFYTRQLEVVLVGLENSGKTTLMNGERAARAWNAFAKRAAAVVYRRCCRDTAFSVCDCRAERSSPVVLSCTARVPVQPW